MLPAIVSSYALYSSLLFLLPPPMASPCPCIRAMAGSSLSFLAKLKRGGDVFYFIKRLVVGRCLVLTTLWLRHRTFSRHGLCSNHTPRHKVTFQKDWRYLGEQEGLVKPCHEVNVRPRAGGGSKNYQAVGNSSSSSCSSSSSFHL